MRRRRFWPFAVLLLFAADAGAVQSVQFSIASLAGAGWRIRGIRVVLHRTGPGRAALDLAVAVLHPPGRAPALRGLSVHCRDARIGAGEVACAAARVRLLAPGLQSRTFTAAFRYRPRAHTLRFSIPALPLTAGRLALRGTWTPSGWSLRASAPALALSRLLAAARRFGLDRPGVRTRGRVGVRIEFHGGRAGIRTFRVHIAARRLNFQEPTGRYAAQRFSGGVDLTARRAGDAWVGRLHVRLAGGELYVEPLYLAIAKRPITARLAFHWRPGTRILRLSDVVLRHPGVLALHGDLALALRGGVRVLRAGISVTGLDLARAYPVYLQPFLYGGALGGLTLTGRVDGRLRYRDGALRELRATLDGVGIEDRDGRFGLRDASGTLGWTEGPKALRSDLAWRAASLYRIPIGAARVRLRSRDAALHLVGRARVPILDGALLIDHLQVDHPGTPRMAWQFAGVLTPVSLRGLTRRLGWTPFSGKLSGMIPRVRYRDHRVRVDGALLVRVFGGEITVRDLVLRHPFGVVPELRADVRVRDLHLASLTRTFPFGKIEGRLNGTIRGLRLEDWRPVRFDARFETPPGDRSRRRISQQAVKSLTRIGGGGIGGLLSGTFLRLFHEFSYRRIGIGCVLHDGVCDMDGVGPAPDGGYYLVEGGGLPRISVVGFVRRVDWGTLVDQVRAVIARGAGGAGP